MEVNYIFLQHQFIRISCPQKVKREIHTRGVIKLTLRRTGNLFALAKTILSYINYVRVYSVELHAESFINSRKTLLILSENSKSNMHSGGVTVQEDDVAL
jgi:hypothetical protein